ncbi:hypothetical protein [Leptospira brenneri]|uniref:hypothetical protein n=1 Tax=Leptospira brenneri TaxID=2023182 RepID=UPI000F6511F3|nr:hypothetical protein [Leptospira brenneri]
MNLNQKSYWLIITFLLLNLSVGKLNADSKNCYLPLVRGQVLPQKDSRGDWEGIRMRPAHGYQLFLESSLKLNPFLPGDLLLDIDGCSFSHPDSPPKGFMHRLLFIMIYPHLQGDWIQRSVITLIRGTQVLKLYCPNFDKKRLIEQVPLKSDESPYLLGKWIEFEKDTDNYLQISSTEGIYTFMTKSKIDSKDKNDTAVTSNLICDQMKLNCFGFNEENHVTVITTSVSKNYIILNIKGIANDHYRRIE